MSNATNDAMLTEPSDCILNLMKLNQCSLSMFVCVEFVTFNTFQCQIDNAKNDTMLAGLSDWILKTMKMNQSLLNAFYCIECIIIRTYQ